MNLVRVSAPTVLPLSLDEVRAHVRLTSDDGDDDNALLQGYIRSATDWVDGERGWLGRALITQTYDYKLDHFQPSVRIPLPPLQAIDSITYLDDGGTTQTLASSGYQVIGAGTSDPAQIKPAYDQVWPSTRLYQPEAVTIRFTAGYGDSWNDVPEPIRHALQVIVGAWYDQCQESWIPMAARTLLQPYRVYSF